MLLPAEAGARVAVVEADERWLWRGWPRGDADVVLWGRIPYRSMVPLRTMRAHVAARERALRALTRRPPEQGRVVAVHRLSPPPGPAGALRAATRDFLLGGAVVELAVDQRFPRVVDVVAARAGVRLVERSLDLGADRAAVARARDQEGQELILRMAPSGVASDPAAAADALERLEAMGVGPVPRLHGRGRVAGANWALESILSGRSPGGITGPLRDQIVEFCAALPAAEGPPTALREELTSLGELFGERVDDFERIWSRLAAINDAAPAVLRHGDLWRGNVLVRWGNLRGIIDWDTWHPSSLPGIDLMHLFASEARRRGSQHFGEVWSGAPWLSTGFEAFSRLYWERLGLSPNPVLLDAIGAAWWTCWATRVLRRHPRLLRDPTWMRHNFEPVVAALTK